MDFIKNLWRGANNVSDDIGANNAKDENQVKKGKMSPIHAFYRELFEVAEGGPNVSKNLKEFRSECRKGLNVFNKAKKNKNEIEIKKKCRVIR